MDDDFLKQMLSTLPSSSWSLYPPFTLMLHQQFLTPKPSPPPTCPSPSLAETLTPPKTTSLTPPPSNLPFQPVRVLFKLCITTSPDLSKAPLKSPIILSIFNILRVRVREVRIRCKGRVLGVHGAKRTNLMLSISQILISVPHNEPDKLTRGGLDKMTLVGPRFCLNPIKIFGGSFGGPTLYENPFYVSPNQAEYELSRGGSTRDILNMEDEYAFSPT